MDSEHLTVKGGLSLASKVAVFSYLIIVANILVFLQSLTDPESYNLLIQTYGLVPVQVMNGMNLLSLVTSMFLHADIIHLGLNMFFLLVSGDAVERELGLPKQHICYPHHRCFRSNLRRSGCICYSISLSLAPQTLRLHSHPTSSHPIRLHNNPD